MQVTVEIPDEIVERLRAEGSDLSRRTLEAFALEEYRAGNLSGPDMMDLLGFESRFDLNDFLKLHNVTEDLLTVEDLQRQREGLRRLGF